MLMLSEVSAGIRNFQKNKISENVGWADRCVTHRPPVSIFMNGYVIYLNFPNALSGLKLRTHKNKADKSLI